MIEIKKEAVLITPEDIKPSSKYLKVVGTFNPGAVKIENGDIVLYVRVLERLVKKEDEGHYYSPRCSGKKKCVIKIDKFDKDEIIFKSENDFVFKDGTKRLTYISHLRRVVLDKSGFNVKFIDKKPSFEGLSKDGELGIEDARITKIGDDYFMTYVSLSIDGNVSSGLAISRDCVNWERKGIIFREQNKDVALFPEKIKGLYYAFNRPEGSFEFSLPHIWISSSKDLKFWGDSSPIKLSRKSEWNYARIGAGAPPLKTNKGWLLIYHGVVEPKKNENWLVSLIKRIFGIKERGATYCVGAALFDLNNPARLIAKSKNPIIYPRKKYEKSGFVNNVVFPTGAVLDSNGDDLLIYSGGADRIVSVKKVGLDDIFRAMERAGQ